MLKIKLPLDGKIHSFQGELGLDDEDSLLARPLSLFDRIVSKDRPHIYYFKLLDCDAENGMTAKLGEDIPRILSKWEIKAIENLDYNDPEFNHFSHEDVS